MANLGTGGLVGARGGAIAVVRRTGQSERGTVVLDVWVRAWEDQGNGLEGREGWLQEWEGERVGGLEGWLAMRDLETAEGTREIGMLAEEATKVATGVVLGIATLLVIVRVVEIRDKAGIAGMAVGAYTLNSGRRGGSVGS